MFKTLLKINLKSLFSTMFRRKSAKSPAKPAEKPDASCWPWRCRSMRWA